MSDAQTAALKNVRKLKSKYSRALGDFQEAKTDYELKYGDAELGRARHAKFVAPREKKKQALKLAKEAGKAPLLGGKAKAKEGGKAKKAATAGPDVAPAKPAASGKRAAPIAKAPTVFACAGNPFDGTPCPHPAEAAKVRAADTIFEKKKYPTCKECKRLVMKSKPKKEEKE